MTTPPRLRWLVVGFDAVAVAAVVVVLAAQWRSEPPLHLPWLAGGWVWAALAALTCLGELASVRIRHGDTAEELAFLEAAVVLDALLLPARLALLAAAVGVLSATVVRRRSPLKAAFNVGNHVTATATMLAVIAVVAGPAGGFSARLVVAVLLATSCYTGINTIGLALVLGVVTGRSPRHFVHEQFRLSALMALGGSGLAMTTVSLGLHNPMLLPYAAVPAAALTYAYRAAAQEAEERDRAALLLRLPGILTGGGDVLPPFLTAIRQAFGVSTAVVVIDEAGVRLAADSEDGVREINSVPAAIVDARQPAILEADRAAPWRQAIVAPLDADGRRVGVLALATDAASCRLDARALTLVNSIAGALAAAMRSNEHLYRLLEERTKLQAVVEQSSDGIVVVDGDGIVALWNPAMTAITGVTDGVGRSLAELLSLRDEHGAPVEVSLAAERPTEVVEGQLERANGEKHWLRTAHSAVFEDGSLVRDVVIVQDLTKQRRVERAKADFIATVSHELRTPLTPIMGYLSLFQSHGDRLPPAKREKCLEIMTERTAHMARLIDDLLLASRIGSDEERGIEGISLARENIVELIERAAVVDANRVRLELPAASAYVCCDATRAVQVLTNLISNGLKYSPAEAPVTVRLQQENAEEVVVEVVDEGRGIPIEEQQRIFEKFHRVEDPLTMTTSGTGLGLYIARRLARAMNGDVTVESAPGAGSTFGLRLPTTGPAQPMASQADTPALPRPRWEKRIERVTQRSTRSDQALHEN